MDMGRSTVFTVRFPAETGSLEGKAPFAFIVCSAIMGSVEGKTGGKAHKPMTLIVVFPFDK